MRSSLRVCDALPLPLAPIGMPHQSSLLPQCVVAGPRTGSLHPHLQLHAVLELRGQRQVRAGAVRRGVGHSCTRTTSVSCCLLLTPTPPPTQNPPTHSTPTHTPRPELVSLAAGVRGPSPFPPLPPALGLLLRCSVLSARPRLVPYAGERLTARPCSTRLVLMPCSVMSFSTAPTG